MQFETVYEAVKPGNKRRRSNEQANTDNGNDSNEKNVTIPQLLTLENSQDMVDYLDAGDVLECYLLTRQTYLHHIFGLPATPPASDSDNSTEAGTGGGGGGHRIPIQTTALGLRYRPPPDGNKPPLTLTLEYGPNREGPDNLHLSVPLVTFSNDDPFYQEPARVHWVNEGQVYYTTEITQDDYVTANFMASLTGAVLSDLLTTASLYPRRHRRYQPWQVVDVSTTSQSATKRHFRFKSSSDYDFVNFMFHHLASVGVELSPVLNPIAYRLQLSAVKMERKTLTPDAHKEMAAFYNNLYRCLDSLATATVLPPLPTPAPTQSPTLSPAPTQSPAPSSIPPTTQHPSNRPQEDAAPTNSPLSPQSANDDTDSQQTLNDLRTPTQTPNPPTTANTQTPTAAPHNTRRREQQQLLQKGSHNNQTSNQQPNEQQQENDSPNEAGEPSSNGLVTPEATSQPISTGGQGGEESLENRDSNFTASNETIEGEQVSVSNNSSDTMPALAPSDHPTAAPITVVETTPNPTPLDSATPTAEETIPPPTPAPISHADAAAEAAAAAQEAADAADDNPEQAVEAAQHAADAAQKAADATSQQQASLRQEALLSGSGVSMAQTASLCLSDPLYGIASSKNANSTTVYLYWDTTYYYSVQVTAPYIQVVPVPATLPKPPPEPTVRQSLALDWILAVVVIFFFLFSVLLVLQQCLGRNFHIIPSLYKFQRWFFDPRHVHYEDLHHTDEARNFGAGYAYTFGQDSIPSSMGGVRAVGSQTPPPTFSYLASPTESFEDEGGDPLGGSGRSRNGARFTIDDESLGDVELSATATTTMKRRMQRTLSGGSNEDLDVLTGESGRLFRDPELVELPDLKSKSKVAVPVSLQGQSTHSSIGSG